MVLAVVVVVVVAVVAAAAAVDIMTGMVFMGTFPLSSKFVLFPVSIPRAGDPEK